MIKKLPISVFSRLMFHTVKNMNVKIDQLLLKKEIEDIAKRVSKKEENGLKSEFKNVLKLEKDLGLDSLGRLELALEIEKHTTVEIPDELISPEKTLNDIIGYVHDKIKGKRIIDIKS